MFYIWAYADAHEQMQPAFTRCSIGDEGEVEGEGGGGEGLGHPAVGGPHHTHQHILPLSCPQQGATASQNPNCPNLNTKIYANV